MSQELAETNSLDPKTPSRFTPLAICIFIAVAVAIVFAQTIHFDFINYDDPNYVTTNRDVTRGLTPNGVAWAMTTGHASNWHPVTWFSHQLDCQIYGMNAGGHHATSVLIHAATAILLFLVLWRMTGDLWPSAFVATVFAIHPLRAESVAWVAERKDVLSGLFFVLTLAAYLRYIRRPASFGRYLAVIVVFAIGLMSKPMLVTVPFVLLLLDYWPLGRMTSRESGISPFSVMSRLIREKIPLFLLAIVSCAVTFLVQTIALVPTECLSLPARAGNAAVSYVTYIVQSFWPTDLTVLYPHPNEALQMWKVIVAVLALTGISAGVLICRRRVPCLTVGWLWYLGMLIPVIGLVQVGAQAHADRYTYLPQIGLLIGLAWGAKHMAAVLPHSRLVFGIASSAIVAALMIGTYHQTAFWRNSEELWERAVKYAPDDNVAENKLGAALMVQDGRQGEAVPHFRRALQTQPSHVEARVNLANVLMTVGKVNEALAQYQMALKIDPDHPSANADYGSAATKLGRYELAEPYLKKALDKVPSKLDARVSYGITLAMLGRMREAVGQFAMALDIDPNCAEAHHNLAITLVRLNRLDSAIQEYEATLRIRPDWAEAHENLGVALAMRRRTGEATEHFRQALMLATQQNKQQLAKDIRARLRQITKQEHGPGL